MPLEIVLKAVSLLLREDPSSTAPHGETRCQVNQSGVSGAPDSPGRFGPEIVTQPVTTAAVSARLSADDLRLS
jgi:hypothetical protein